MQLRDYLGLALEAVKTNFEKGINRQLLALATGCGKTIIFAHLPYQKRPLSPKTLARIAKGLEKFGGALAPYYIQLLGLTTGQKVTEWQITPESQIGGDNLFGSGIPFLMDEHSKACYRDTNQPIPTVTTKAHPMLIEPKAFVMGKQSTPSFRGMDEPVQTLTTDGVPMLVEPCAFTLGQQSGAAPRETDKPVATIAADGAIALIQSSVKPFLVNNRLGANDNVETCSRVRGIDSPIPTVTSHGVGSVVTPLMIKYYGGDDISSIDAPVPTVTTKDRFGLVQPFILEINHSGGDGRPSDIEKPFKTLTGKKGSAIVRPLVVEPVLEPATGRINPRRLVLIDGQPYCLDIRFRMLENLELARAMGFTDSESTYEFAGNKSEVTKQIGNAVPVNLAKALVKTILEDC